MYDKIHSKKKKKTLKKKVTTHLISILNKRGVYFQKYFSQNVLLPYRKGTISGLKKELIIQFDYMMGIYNRIKSYSKKFLFMTFCFGLLDIKQ